MTATEGQNFARTLRAMMHIGFRTRRYRDGGDLFNDMLEQAQLASTAHGYHSEAKEAALQPGFAAVNAWQKHVGGYRIDATQSAYLNSLTPWQFATVLGDMVDAGVTNSYEGEQYFAERVQADRQAWNDRYNS